MFEVLNFYKLKIQKSDILKKLNLIKKAYFIVSAHREENVDHVDNLTNIIFALNKLADQYNMPIIVTTHPRTQKQLSKLNTLKIDKRIQFLKPFGFYDYNCLQLNALCSISDSGTISEESSILKFPAVTIRNSMERPEALDTGSIILTGLDPDIIVNAVDLAINESTIIKNTPAPHDYRIENTSWRVLKLIMGTAKLSHLWQGIQK